MPSPSESSSVPAFPARSRTPDQRLAWFFTAAACALVSGHFLAADSRDLALAVFSRCGLSGGWLTLLAVVLLGCVMVRLYRERLAHRLRVLDAVAVLLSSHWVCLGLHHTWHSPAAIAAGPSWVALGWVLLESLVFVASSVGAFHLHHELETTRSLQRVRTADRVRTTPVRGLILLVSPPTTVPQVATLDAARQPGGWAASVTADIKLPADLAGAIDELDKYKPFHNWQQLLRSIAPVRENLEHVWLLGSPGKPPLDALTPHRRSSFNDGSRLYLPLCRDFLRHYLRPETVIHGADADDLAVEFEDFDQLLDRLRRQRPAPFRRIAPAEVAIDVTGGIKIASIAGAVLTLKQETVIQYVQTVASPAGQAAKPEAQIYDLRWDSPPHLG
jgi:hypothetical protein